MRETTAEPPRFDTFDNGILTHAEVLDAWEANRRKLTNKYIGNNPLFLELQTIALEQVVPGFIDILVAYLTMGDGDFQKFDVQIQPEFEIELPNNIDLTIIPRLRLEVVDELEPGHPAQNELSEISRRLNLGDNVQLELRELYIEATAG
ncbi:MAG: hypothetical protein IIB65_06330, partial [Proteobacteria bacterium]|nr:hypothetical protein [Pseudomonadota bacterium]